MVMATMDSLLLLLLPAFGLAIRIDMSYTYDENTHLWPGGKTLTYSDRSGYKADGTWYSTKDFCLAEHSGTHLDAPVHFSKNGWKVGDIPFTRLFGPGVKVDITEKAKTDSDALLEVKDIENWEKEHGEIPQGAILLVYSGWGKYWTNRTAYFGAEGYDTSKYHFPGVSTEAAEWIVKSGKIVGLGIDSASIDSGESAGHEAHVIVSKANIYNLENVANVDKVPPSGFSLSVLPLKLLEGTGAPCRIVGEVAESGVGFVSAKNAVVVYAAVTSILFGAIFV